MQLAAPMPSMCTWHHCTPQSPEPKWSVNPPNVINTALLMLNSFSFSFRKTSTAVLPTLILFAPPIDIIRNIRRMDRGATTTAGEVISMTIRMRIQGHGSRRQAFGTAFFYLGCFLTKEFHNFISRKELVFPFINKCSMMHSIHTHTHTHTHTPHTHTHTYTHTHTAHSHT